APHADLAVGIRPRNLLVQDQFAKELYKIVGETVVIVDYSNHGVGLLNAQSHPRAMYRLDRDLGEVVAKIVLSRAGTILATPRYAYDAAASTFLRRRSAPRLMRFQTPVRPIACFAAKSVAFASSRARNVPS